MNLKKIISEIITPDNSIKEDAQKKIDLKTKPIGSLGTLESIAVKMSIIQNNLNPVIKNKAIFVFAGDHGITEEGVSAYPSEVTQQMVLNFLSSGAAINVLSRHNDIRLFIIDMGVNYDFDKESGVIDMKVRKGTRNFLYKPAMTLSEAEKSIKNGIDAFINLHNRQNIDILGIGDMGIGNTTSSSAIISAITGLDAEKTTGRGTGINNEALNKKIETINKALELHKPDKNNPLEILARVGGYEIAGMTGAILAATYHHIPVVLDGIISTAAGLLAYKLNPNISEYLFAAHMSIEQGQQYALEYMNLSPILNMNMRLGEGTGAALAINIIEAACKIMTEMSSFDKAKVSQKINE